MAEDVTRLLDRLGSLFPSYFSFVMATGILVIAGVQLGHLLLGAVLFGISLLAYCVVWICGGLRVACAPRTLWPELRHHETGPGFLTIVAASSIVGSDAAAFGMSGRFVLGLFSVAVLAWVCLIYCFLVTMTEGRDKPPLEKGLTGSWLLVVVSTASLAVLGSDVFQIAGAPPALVFFCYVWLILGWFYYTILASVIFYRFAFVPMSPSEIAGPWWINAGAAAITVLAGGKLMQQPDLAIGVFPLRALISPIVTVFWADATFWIPLLVLLFAWKHLARARPFRYSVELWSVAFPIGMYAAASLQFATVFELPFVRPAAHVTAEPLCLGAVSHRNGHSRR